MEKDMKKFKLQKNCTDYLGNKGIFAETRDTTTTKKRYLEGWPCRRSLKNVTSDLQITHKWCANDQ